MSNTGLAVAPRAGEVAPILQQQEWESSKNLALIRNTVAPGLNEAEFMLFCHVARVRHLDPLQRQIHAVVRSTKRANGEGYENKMTIQTGIDGFRAIANRTGVYMPSSKLPLVEGQGGPDLRVTVWVKKFSPRDKAWHEYGATAYYREFVQTRRENGGKMVPVAMWEKMPLGQTEKCAEAKALRRGWPEELGQIYVDEEMQQADAAPEVQTPHKQDRTQREVGTLKVSTQANRGHGNEGMQRVETAAAEPVICNECRGVNRHEADCPLQGNATRADGSVDYGFDKTMPVEAEERPQQAGEDEESAASKKWRTADGHDPKKHISFKQGRLLFAIQKSRQLSDGVLKALLQEEFQVEHRYLIPKDKFSAILDAIDPNFAHHEKK